MPVNQKGTLMMKCAVHRFLTLCALEPLCGNFCLVTNACVPVSP